MARAESRRTGKRRRSRAATRRAVPGAAAPVGGLHAGELAILAAVFAAIALVVYSPSLSGPFVSDDLHYVATNPYVHELTFENVVAILDPRSPATVFVVNYAPVHLLLHGLTWQLAGEQTTAYHVVNVLFHALGSALLAAVFVRTGVPRAVAAPAALLFLVHPANVEAVAWISQAKTPVAFALAMAALLAYPRRPGLATVWFGLALLAKPTAAIALPVAALLDWILERRVRLGWMVAWGVLLAGYGVAEFATHNRSGAAEPVDPSSLVRLRTSVGIAARYLWMAATSLGVSTFHEPPPARSWLDGWWLAGLVCGAAVFGRALVAWRRRSPELAFWIWAVGSFLPVSQLFPFLHPMADRYLYFILPGLLGGVLFLGSDVALRLRERGAAPTWLQGASIVGVLVVALAFGAHASERARIWVSPVFINLDAASHYPEGRLASLVEARRAAQRGDGDAAIAALRRAVALGFNRYEQLSSDPALASLRGDPRFEAIVHDLAGWWVDRFSAKQDATQIELRVLALAHLARGERTLALRALEQALAKGGPLDARLLEEIAQVRALPD